MRALSRQDLAATCEQSGAGMDQILYDMPTVAGWPSNQGWVSSGAWLARLNFAAAVVATQGSFPDPVDAVQLHLDGVVGPTRPPSSMQARATAIAGMRCSQARNFSSSEAHEMITRRDFMVSGITATGVGIIVPPVFAQSVFAATMDDIHNDRVLVILQLGGGNDGLNTVVPYADPAYLQARPTIGIPADKVLPLNAEIGLNPVMPGIKKLFDAGEVALVQGVGYPNPVYSHFEGLYIWEHADPTMEQTDGWLGKLLASRARRTGSSTHRMRSRTGQHTG